jgi:pentapeptide repeat protein
MTTPQHSEFARLKKLHSKLERSKWSRWAARLMEHPWAIRMTMIWIAVVVLALTVSWWLLVPVTDWLAHHDVGSASGSLLQTARDAARARLLTLGAGLFAAGVLLYTAQTFALSRQGQVTDRYTKAVEQLGSDKIEVRIGGIYALERIARDSKRDHPRVMELLTAFVRVRSDEQVPRPEPGGAGPPRADVQAALTVIGRRLPWRDKGRPIDLTHAILAGANLVAADLRGADLTGADLTGAVLTDADLNGTILTSAKWPEAEPVPRGWQRDTASGLLAAVGSSAGQQE